MPYTYIYIYLLNIRRRGVTALHALTSNVGSLYTVLFILLVIMVIYT